MFAIRPAFLLVATALALGACAGAAAPAASSAATTDESAALYAPDHIVEIAIDLAPTDWDKIRFEGANPAVVLDGACQSAPPVVKFSVVHAAVTIDGVKMADVGLRKKGFLGSASVSKPSLKVKFTEFDANQQYLGVDKLTLNNNKQDASNVKTCLAYQLYAKAGVPAPRCNFAHVKINGTDMGVYTNVEPIDRSMLRRVFGDDSGNLYEGQMSDFRPGWMDTYNLSTNSATPDRSDLKPLSDALQLGDAEVTAKTAQYLDMDAWLTFWAMEAILGSWDTYSTTQNNHYVYHNPVTGKFQFIPWGPDMTFSADDPLHLDRPQSLSAWGAIPNRLYKLADVRTQLRARVLEKVDAVMHADAILAEIDRMQKQLEPFADNSDGQFTSALDDVRLFVKARHDRIHKELDGGPVEWTLPMNTSPCQHKLGTIEGKFTTKMGSTDVGNPFKAGTGAMTLALDGTTTTASAVGAAIGRDNLQIQLQNTAFLPNGEARIAVIFVDRSLLKSGAQVALDGQRGFGAYGKIDIAKGAFAVVGMLTSGTITFDSADLAKDSTVTGSYTADVRWSE